MLGQQDLLLVVPQLEVGDVVLLDLGHVLAARALLLALLELLVQLLGRLLGPPRQVLCADLAAEDAGLVPVGALDAQGDLGEDELGLFAAVHGPKRLDLQLAQDVGGGAQVALLLLDVRQHLGDARALHLDKDLALGHGAQRLDDRQLGLEVGGLVEELHDLLYHARDGLLELPMLLGQHERLVVEELPVAGIFADGDDGDEDAGCRGEVGGLEGGGEWSVSWFSGGVLGGRRDLTRLLLEQGELLDGGIDVCLCQGLGLGDLLVDLLGEVLLGLERSFRHGGRASGGVEGSRFRWRGRSGGEN